MVDRRRQANPLGLAELVSAIPEPAFNRKRGEGYWTIFEHLLHLAETQEVLMARLEMFRDQPHPVITPYAPTRLAGKGTPAAASLVEAFTRWREKQVRLIEGVAADVWRKTVVHPQFPLYKDLFQGIARAARRPAWTARCASRTPGLVAAFPRARRAGILVTWLPSV